MSVISASRTPQYGFTLIEVLVALLILAIGLLGLAALQTQGVRFNHDAAVRTQATSLAADLLERLRIERIRLEELEAVNPGVAQYPQDLDQFTTANFPDKPYVMSKCDPTGVSVADQMYCWLTAVSEQLPNGTANIAQQAADPAALDITLTWLDREPRNFGGATRLAKTKDECEQQAMRQWAATRCMVMQTWTVRP